jgi:hypothetical protein
MKLLRYILLTLLVAWHGVPAAPPSGGFMPVEKVITYRCQQAQTVVLAHVTDLRIEPIPTGERRIAHIEVRRVLKGKAEHVPHYLSHNIRNPSVTDAIYTYLDSGKPYLVFFGPGAAGTELILPTSPYTEVPLDYAISLTEAACGTPEPEERAPPNNSSKPTPLRSFVERFGLSTIQASATSGSGAAQLRC